MELITLGIGYIVNVLAKNQEVRDTVDEFVSASAKWVKGWFSKTDNADLAEKIVASPESKEVKKELNSALNDMMSDNQFRVEFEEWVAEYDKPMPSMKNVLENVKLKVKGNMNIGDKEGNSGVADVKNVVKDSEIEVGGDFNLGDLN